MPTSLSVIFIIMILEGLNLTGIPAVVILPAIGLLASEGQFSIITVLVITIFGSIIGNVIYYVVILLVGPKLYDKLYTKFKGIRKSLDRADELIGKYGNKACCIGRLIPGVRTVISLIASTFRISFSSFFIYSSLGIIVWNSVLLLSGYWFTLF